MKVEVSGYVWLDASELTDQQKANIRHLLTIYPSRTSEHEKKDPPPIALYCEDDDRNLIGVPRSFYLEKRRGEHEEVVKISDGFPMKKFDSLMSYEGEYAEQAVAIDVLIEKLTKHPDFGGTILKGGCGFGKCVIGASMVHTDKGIVQIGDLVPDLDDESRPDETIAVDGFYGMSGTSHVYAKRSVPCLKVMTSQGYHVSGTHVHPMLVLSKNGFEWKKLSDVEIGDWMVGKTFDLNGSPRMWAEGFPNPLGPMNPEDGYAFGQLTGDGSVGSDQMRLSSADAETREWFSEYLHEFGLKWKSYPDRPCDMYVSGGRKTLEAFGEMGLSLTTSHYKRIPWSVLQGGKEIASAFIQGLMDADGHVNKTARFIEITSASEGLMRDLQVLLLGFGVKSQVKLKRGKYDGSPVWHWRLIIHRSDVPRYVKKIGFRLGRKMSDAQSVAQEIEAEENSNPNVFLVPVRDQMKLEIDRVFDSSARRSFKNYTSGKHQPSRSQVCRFVEEAGLESHPFWREVIRDDLFFDPVVTIEDDGEHRVCDLTVPHGSNFLANGLVVHNTNTSLALAHKLGVRTLILVHKEFLMNQWRRRIEEFMPDARVGIIRQARCEFRDVDFAIAMLDSLESRIDKYPPELYDAFGLVITDEVHRLGAQTWAPILPRFSARYRLGLTATPRRKDDAEAVFFRHIGPIGYAARTRPTLPLLRKIVTDTTLRGKMVEGGKIKKSSELGRSEIVTQLSKVPERTRQIMEDVLQGVKRGRKVLILSERLEHLKDMAGDLNSLLSQVDLPFIPTTDFYVGEWFTGETDENGQPLMVKVGKGRNAKWRLKTKRRTESELRKAESANVIFATVQMVSEGLDIQALDVLVIATPIGDIEQAAGRVRRRCYPSKSKCERLCSWRAGVCQGKPQPIIADVVDEEVPQAKGKWRSRSRFYRQEGML